MGWMDLVDGDDVSAVSFMEKGCSGGKIEYEWQLMMSEETCKITLVDGKSTGLKKLYMNSKLVCGTLAVLGMPFKHRWRCGEHTLSIAPAEGAAAECRYRLSVDGCPFQDLQRGDVDCAHDRGLVSSDTSPSEDVSPPEPRSNTAGTFWDTWADEQPDKAFLPEAAAAEAQRPGRLSKLEAQSAVSSPGSTWATASSPDSPCGGSPWGHACPRGGASQRSSNAPPWGESASPWGESASLWGESSSPWRSASPPKGHLRAGAAAAVSEWPAWPEQAAAADTATPWDPWPAVAGGAATIQEKTQPAGWPADSWPYVGAGGAGALPTASAWPH